MYHFEAGAKLTVRCAMFFITAATLAMGGCGWFTSSSGGEVLVGRPEVFTRQRLVNRRLTEQQWLEYQLANKTPTEQSFQGFRDIRTFAGLYNRSNVAFDPLAGRLTVAQNTLDVQSLQNQADVHSLQQQIDVLKLQQQIAALQKAGSESTNATTPNTPATGGSSSGSSSSAPSSSPGGPSVSSTAATSSTSSSSTTPSPSGIFANAPEVPSANDIVTTQAKLTSIELLRDQLAWRNAVQAALREQELDDSHDLAGLVLYTLKFDLSVLPQSQKYDGYAKIEFDLSKSTTNTYRDCQTLQNAYYSWFWHFRRDVNIEAVALQQRLELEMLSEEERIRLAAAAATRRLDEPNESYDALVGALLGPYDQPKSATEQPTDDAKREAVKLIQRKYTRSIPMGLVDFSGEPLPIGVAGKRYYVPSIPTPDLKCYSPTIPTDGVLAKFYELTKTLSVPPVVFVTDPKEQAQNISDVAAIEQLQNMVLSLQAVLPQYGITAGNYTEYMKRSQERLQAIVRRPLMVAYSDRGERFGWLLGPRFEIGRNGRAKFAHTAAQHSVQLSIVVPGWTQTFDIAYKTYWVDRHGRSHEGDGGRLSVTLPGDDTAITTNLLAATGDRRIPFIEPPMDSKHQFQRWRVQAKQPADILIYGANLWRNPRVFLGGQPADSVTVLPDMRGLSARFNSITMPLTKSNETPYLDLAVVTSEGIATLKEAVEVFPDAVAPNAK
jgi:hypothetical protein